MRLFLLALARFTAGVALTGGLLFWSAGGFGYWNAWLLMGVLFLPMLGGGVWMAARRPDLLRQWMRTREHPSQHRVILLSGLLFVAGFVLSGLGWRWQWGLVPRWVSLAAAGVLLAAYLLYGEVLRENAYLSRSVEVQPGQKVVDSGLYGIVRHPMYSATILLFLAIPLVLGSLWAFGLFLLYPVLLIGRIRQEEKLLSCQLPGYADYMQRVRWRLLPGVW